MKIIKSVNKVPQDIMVDDSTYSWAKDHGWYIDHHGYAWTRISCLGNGKLTMIYLHRAIKSEPANKLVDHRDRNKLNCQESNLRVCTKGENQCNSAYKIPGATSKYKGVSWQDRENKWRAQISYNNKTYWLGYFDTEIDAARAYDTACILHHKSYGVLNNV